MKKRLKAALSAVLLLTVMLSGGCQDRKPEAAEMPQTETEEIRTGIETEKILEAYQMGARPTSSYKYSMHDYDMGSFVYQTGYGKEMPYKLRGVLGMPEGEGPFPLVILIHGSHANTDETLRFDTGFSYLVEALAESGYVAAAIDVSAAYQWKYGDSDDAEKTAYLTGEHLKMLQAANKGEGEDFLVELKGRIDFSRTALIGHSRGAYTAFDIAGMYQDICSINAVISIAPAAGADADTRSWPDCDTAVLVPEYDGDVSGLDGVAIYDILKTEGERKSILTYLKNANHNYFNDNLTENDALLMYDEKQLAEQITREKQQEFLKNYVKDFLGAVNSEDETEFYDTFGRIPDTMYGFDITSKYQMPGERRLLDAENDDAAEEKNCELEEVTDSWFYEEDEILPDTVTIGQNLFKTKELLEVKSGKGGSVKLEERIGDISSFRYLCIDLLSDPQALEAQNLRIALTDTNGNAVSVLLSEEINALKKTPGEVSITEIYDEKIENWSRITPISGVCIPLEEYGELDLKNIRNIVFYFDQAEQTHLYVEAVTLK